jgi:acyl carrier protein
MSATYVELREKAEERAQMNRRIKEILVEGLELPLTVDQIDSDQPLFGRGLELDSLDTLEIVSLFDDEWDVAITDDQKYIFGSINKLADYISENQGTGHLAAEAAAAAGILSTSDVIDALPEDVSISVDALEEEVAEPVAVGA